MKISKRGEYALRALIDLGIASELGWPMLQISELASKVIRLIEVPLAPIRCVSQTSYARCSCPDEAHCGLRILMFDVRNAISTILDRYTLADIVEITLRKYRRDKVTPPFLHRASSLTSMLSKQTKSPVERKSKPEALKQLSGSRGSQLQNGHAKRAAR